MNIGCCCLHKPAFTLTQKGPPDILLVTAGVRKMEPDFSLRRRDCPSSGRWLCLLSVCKNINDKLIKYNQSKNVSIHIQYLNQLPPYPYRFSRWKEGDDGPFSSLQLFSLRQCLALLFAERTTLRPKPFFFPSLGQIQMWKCMDRLVASKML